MLAQNVNGAFGAVVLERAEAAFKAAAHATAGSKNDSSRQPKRKRMSIAALMSNMQRGGMSTEIQMPRWSILMTSEEIRETLESGRRTMSQIDASDRRLV